MSHEGPPQFNGPPAREGKVSREQKAAMNFAARIGREIQENYPEIAVDFKKGLSLSNLVRKYGIKERFGFAHIDSARIAVMNALNGYVESPETQYPGLLDPETFKAIAEKHRKDSGKKMGETARDTGRGIFGMTDEQKIERGKKSGIGAVKSQAGIHAPGFKRPSLSALSFEARSKNSKAKAVEKGLTVLSDDAENFIRGLDLNNREYITNRGQVNLKKITQEVNERFYQGNETTNVDAVSSFLRRLEKRRNPAT